jgi:DNA-binding transcriptional MocR family regulator
MASPVLEQLVAVAALAALDSIVAERKPVLRERRDVLARAIDEHAPAWRCSLPHGGLYLWVELPKPSSTSLSVRARERGVHITPGPRFGAPGLLDRFVRLPFTLPVEQLEAAVETLAAEAERTEPRRGERQPQAYVA